MNWKLPAVAAMACMIALPAAAQQDDVRGKQAGDIVLGFSVLGVLPQSGGRVDAVGGKPEASDTVTLQVDVTWFATPNLSLNLIAATTRHDVNVRGSALGDVELGRVWLLPPTLTLQYHPLPQSRFSPYVGAGINYSVFYNEGGSRSAAISKVDVENSWGWALNVGVDYELTPHWGVNFDVKKLFLRPDVSVNGGAIGARADLDPWIIGAGVRYRF
jgi:outer membrane protein